MTVVPIRKTDEATQPKSVDSTQKGIDALPFDSGTWRVEGIPGLYVRCRAKSRSFFVQRRVDREVLREYLGELSMKAAKIQATKKWSELKPKPSTDGVITLGAAIKQYVAAKTAAGKMAPKTAKIANYNSERYLDRWKDRSLASIGGDRKGVRELQQKITADHGPATSNQVIRLLAAVYRWFRAVDEELPEWRKAAEIHNIKARDWAYSPDELRSWWHAIAEKDGKPLEKKGRPIYKGVTTLGPIKRMWWLTALFTGARKGSIEALRWQDVDLEKKVIHFRVTKGDRPYAVPVSEKLSMLLAAYKANDDVPPSEWVFPSNIIDGAHLIDVKNTAEGVGPAHRLRHTFRTTLAELGAGPDQARMLMGHSMGGDVSRGYISTPLVVESLRPIVNAVSEHYLKIVPAIEGPAS